MPSVIASYSPDSQLQAGIRPASRVRRPHVSAVAPLPIVTLSPMTVAFGSPRECRATCTIAAS